MAGRGGASGQVERHHPGAPPQEGQGAGRRRWQQQHQHAFSGPLSSQRRGTEAATRASPPAPPGAGKRSWRAAAAEGPLPTWRRLSVEPAELALGKLCGRRDWWHAPAGRLWQLLAACLTCCFVLGWYAASRLRDLAPQGGRWREKDPEPVTVLLWWEPFGHSWVSGDCWRLFNISACSLSTNRSRQQDAHAVLFHHRDLIRHGTHQLPRLRPPGQRWVWMNFESPSHTTGLRELAGLFNWTMTYRVDSDVFVPYGYLKLRPQPLAQPTLPRKTKLVAWVISNWNEDHDRVRYYHQLKNYLPVDIYGAHGLALKDGNMVKTVSEYKFYLAFENSQHQDYITEKLWRNAFESWAVPIVLGPPRANYERFVPSDSFIHVSDFSGPMELAVYLKFLDKNKNMYRKYFAWRKQYEVRVTSFWVEHSCKVCNAVRVVGKQSKTIQNLANWFES
ncbi:alpha-(1,3)-fucosyltransferase 4 [Candoia aspera]|uniref:alpha-(1,3)-fucosyltransferase 4 n=1 Tax=Candoia aspera TaxID=51853 RepID=UPI002FD8117E